MSLLLRSRLDVLSLDGLLLLRSRPCRHAAMTSVIAYPVRTFGPVPVAVCIGPIDVSISNVVGCGVVGEMVVLPASAAVAASPVTVPVIDTAVKADGRSPVARIKTVSTVVPSPVGRGPIESYLRRLHPCAVHPVVFALVIIVSPVTGRPDETIIRHGRLFLDDQRRWRDPDGNGNLSGCRHRTKKGQP